MSREMIMGESPRVVGIVGAPSGEPTGTLAGALALAMAAGGVRVLAGCLGSEGGPLLAASDAGMSGLKWLALPARTGAVAGDHHALRAAIEEAGRDTDRVVLDLGSTAGAAAMLFGSAVDDLLLLLGESSDAVGAAAAYLGMLADAWDRDEVHVVVSGAGDPATAAARVRELMVATAGASPCLVPFGILSSRTASSPSGIAERLEAARVMAEALLRRPLPSVRGGLQFFLEDRAALRGVS